MIQNINNISPIFMLLILLSCGSIQPQKQGTKPISHELYDQLLKKHVAQNGMVDYNGFLGDTVQLNLYLNKLSDNPPNDKFWSEKEQLAYWINAYNAFTLKLVLQHYPVKSIKDIGAKIQVPFVNTPWDIKFIEIEDEKYDLNNIEHNILRKNFDEPRIHFAIVCASLSCPKLRREAYVAESLNDQLTEQAKGFLSDSFRNVIKKDKVEISKIFSWFKGDFTKNQTLIEFLNLYSDIEIDPKAKISHMNYDWSLNEKL